MTIQWLKAQSALGLQQRRRGHMDKSRAIRVFELVEATLVQAGDLAQEPRTAFHEKKGRYLTEVKTGVEFDDSYFKAMSFVVLVRPNLDFHTASSPPTPAPLSPQTPRTPQVVTPGDGRNRNSENGYGRASHFSCGRVHLPWGPEPPRRSTFGHAGSVVGSRGGPPLPGLYV